MDLIKIGQFIAEKRKEKREKAYSRPIRRIDGN